MFAGEITNDAFAPVRAPRALRTSVRQAPAAGRRLRRRASATSPAIAGRWLPAAPLFAGASEADRARARAEILLERHGVVTRSAVRAEAVSGGFGGVYGELAALELTGAARRGYFVEGLGGAQFALPGAVERLRDLREPGVEPETLVLAAADPAQPYGAALGWPARAAGRASRTAGAHVVLVDGRAILFVERRGRSLLPLCEPDDPAVGTAVAALGEAGAITGRLAVERFDGAGVLGSPVEAQLLAAGFRAGPRRLTLG